MDANVCVWGGGCCALQSLMLCHSMDLGIGWSWWAGSETRWALWALAPLPPTDSSHCDTPAAVHNRFVMNKTIRKILCFSGLKPFWYLDFIGDLVRWIVSAQDVNPVSHPHCSGVETGALEWPLTFPHTRLRAKTIDLSRRKDTAWRCYTEKSF